MKTDEQQTALREPRYSIGWSMDERSLYLTDHVEDDHVVIVKFTENWTNETKRKTLRALVDIADALAGEGACRDIALLDAPAQGAPPAESIRDEAQAILAHEPVAFAECTVAEDVMARARRILELLS